MLVSRDTAEGTTVPTARSGPYRSLSEVVQSPASLSLVAAGRLRGSCSRVALTLAGTPPRHPGPAGARRLQRGPRAAATPPPGKNEPRSRWAAGSPGWYSVRLLRVAGKIAANPPLTRPERAETP